MRREASKAFFPGQCQQALPVAPVPAVQTAIGGAPFQFGARVVPVFQLHLLQCVEVVGELLCRASTAEHVRKTQ